MLGNERIVLSFVDNSVRVQHFGHRSSARILSGFKFKQLEKKFESLGFETLPEFVGEILYANGYRKDYNLNMWVVKTTGTASCSPEDEYNETTGYRLSVMRAKEKAYYKALVVINELMNVFVGGLEILTTSAHELSRFFVDEGDAIERVIETGKSDIQ